MEAWTQWQTHDQNIDLVIADIYLPDGVTGFELVRHMKAQRPSLPVIYMSGYQPDTFSEGENLTIGINYLSKPFDVLDLLSTTARALEASTPPTAGQAFRPVTSEPYPAQKS
jgi:DNA-binding NtrC family response regulator